MNAVEREPVPIRVLNLNTSEASYEPKQRSYRKTKLIFFWGGFCRGILSGNLTFHNTLTLPEAYLPPPEGKRRDVSPPNTSLVTDTTA